MRLLRNFIMLPILLLCMAQVPTSSAAMEESDEVEVLDGATSDTASETATATKTETAKRLNEDESETETMVVTGSRTLKRLSETPVATELIGHTEIAS